MTLLVVVGPTASGKTELAVELGARIGGEVVSADSVQVYREFDIGTGKPSAEQRARVPHHLIDVVDPLDAMDAARWAALAAAAVADIRARGKTPIVCGGTFLWIKALLFGLAPAPPGDEAVRARHRELVAREGRAALHAELARVDAESAERLAPNDFVRVSRALEVFELTRLPISRWHAEHGFREPRFAARLVGVQQARADHDRRIAERVGRMLEAGFVAEVQKLLSAGYAGARAMSSVGYKQVAAALADPDPLDAAELAAEIVRATRVFARRQRTWLREQPVTWIDPERAARGELT